MGGWGVKGLGDPWLCYLTEKLLICLVRDSSSLLVCPGASEQPDVVDSYVVKCAPLWSDSGRKKSSSA